MRKSLRPVIDAFLLGIPKKITNTESTGDKLYLFGNCIAKWEKGEIYISDGGHGLSLTTKDRLNGLGAQISTKNGIHYFKGIEWDGKWININHKPEVKQEKTLF